VLIKQLTRIDILNITVVYRAVPSDKPECYQEDEDEDGSTDNGAQRMPSAYET
jgi:hypothetical protein